MQCIFRPYRPCSYKDIPCIRCHCTKSRRHRLCSGQHCSAHSAADTCCIFARRTGSLRSRPRTGRPGTAHSHWDRRSGRPRSQAGSQQHSQCRRRAGRPCTGPGRSSARTGPPAASSHCCRPCTSSPPHRRCSPQRMARRRRAKAKNPQHTRDTHRLCMRNTIKGKPRRRKLNARSLENMSGSLRQKCITHSRQHSQPAA
jgi:hypothetical protein